MLSPAVLFSVPSSSLLLDRMPSLESHTGSGPMSALGAFFPAIYQDEHADPQPLHPSLLLHFAVSLDFLNGFMAALARAHDDTRTQTPDL